MTISRDDAAQALSDIASAQNRSYALAGYSMASPILIIWGLIWMAAYTAMGLMPVAQWGLVWLPADIIGILATLVLTGRATKKVGAKGQGWRIIGFMVLILVTCSGLFAMIRTQDLNVYMAFPGLLAGAIYATIGLSRMPRYLWLGAAVIAASLVGFFVFPSILPYWMAVAGGGGLIVGGLLFRRA